MLKHIFITLLTALGIFAQDPGLSVRVSESPADVGFQTIITYSGANPVYICYAKSTQPQFGENTSTKVTVSAASNANPVSFTATAHGFDYQSGATTTPLIFISGGTGNWTAINGLWIATPTGANTFTIPVDSTTFGALSGTLVVSTRAARTNQPKWAIKHLIYNGSNNVIWTGWASASASLTATLTADLVGGGPKFTFKCETLTQYGYQ